MNYFAHGFRFLDDPYFVAGTAVPDWLNVVNRRVKARSKSAALFTIDADPRMASLAAGVVQHHFDDRWFHQTPAFAKLSLDFTVGLRDLLGADRGFRPSFVGHILVELLLDAELHSRYPRALDQYYAVISTVDPHFVMNAVSRIATGVVDSLAVLIPRFSTEQFLYDYADDERLFLRLNNVMDRVHLERLPNAVTGFFPQARQAVRQETNALLAGPVDSAEGLASDDS